MRVTHISIIHKPLEPRIFERECRDLASAGYEVHLLVPRPPAARIGGVRLHAIASESDRPSFMRQLARLSRAARCALKLRPSVFHLHDPHLIPLGVVLKLGGSRVVYDVHEDYPAYARSKGSAHPLRGRIKALVWILLEWLARTRFDRFVCASPALARRFPAARTVVIRNFPRYADFTRAAANVAPRPYRDRPSRLISTGYLREMRCFWEITRALELLPSELDCRLRAIGAFRPPELEERARELAAWRAMDVLPWQPHPVVLRELFDAKIGLLLLHRLPNHDDPIRSNKLFEFMAAGIPVIASDLPPWRSIVCGIGCGVVVHPSDPTAIAAAIERLLTRPEEAEAMGERGRAAVRAGLNWEGEAPTLISMYRALAGRPSGTGAPAATDPQMPAVPIDRRASLASAAQRVASK